MTRGNARIRCLGVTANCGKERAVEVLRRVVARAKAQGLRLVADEPTAALLKPGAIATSRSVFDEVDAVMALGGDGTLLRVARELRGRDIPVIGVNIGGLGFLTSVTEKDLGRAMRALADGDFVTSARSIADCAVVRDGKVICRYRALNDVVIHHAGSGRVATLDVSIDGEAVTSYACDGLIVSTPTGSTGHSLSAGGPIVLPGACTLIVSLICPHTLSSRPLVVPDRSVISIEAMECDRELILSVDGQVGRELAQGDRVRVRRSSRGVRFIHLPDHSYFAVLRQKLHWRGSSV